MRQTFYQLSGSALTTQRFYDDTGIRSIESNETYESWPEFSDIVTISSRPMSTALKLVNEHWATLVRLEATSLQPVVKTFCTENTFDQDVDQEHTYLDFRTDESGKINDSISLAHFRRFGTSDKVSGTTGSGTVFWQERPASASASASTYSILYAEGFDTIGQTYISACTVIAHWASSVIEFTSSNSSLTFKLHDHDEVETSVSSIFIAAEWAKLIRKLWSETTILDSEGSPINKFGAPFIALGLSDAVPTSEKGAQFCSLEGRVVFMACGATANIEQQRLAIYHLLRETNLGKENDQAFISTTTNWTDPSTLTQVPLEIYANGYSYNNSGVPVQLSLVVLGIYCLIVIVYLTYTFITGRTASSWDSTSELIMLAMHSQRPTHLQGTTVGIDTLSTLREPVSIRVNDEGSAELVFENDAGAKTRRLRGVVPNEAY